LACMAFLVFNGMSLADVTSAQCGLDHYSFLNCYFHLAYK
jgi:hypothetical protein